MSRQNTIKQDNENDGCEISEYDLYPPEDNRLIASMLYDIIGGDNFSDYLEYFFDNYELEIFDW